MQIILASGSPRRIELLRALKLVFEIYPPGLNEEELFPPEGIFYSRQELLNFAQMLALKKAKEIAARIKSNALILAADTLVVLENKLLGKPKNLKEAEEMLKMLSGKKHLVITGVALLKMPEKIKKTAFSETEVWFNRLTDSEIKNYLKTGEALDKAGAYGIQGFGSLLVKKIKGCYFNVVGFPVGKVARMLKRFKVDLLLAGGL